MSNNWEKRDFRYISNWDLSGLLKISPADVITIETGVLPQDVDVIIDLCRILKCTCDYILGHSSNPKRSRNILQ